MTSCAEVRENLSAYADDELSIEERQSFEEHIGRCPSCREELDDMLRIIAICRSLPQQELPEGFSAELHEKLTAVSSRRENIHVIRDKPKKPAFTRTIASLAAGILLIFLGGGIVRFGLLSGSPMSKSSGNADTAASTPAPTAAADDGDMAFSFSAAPEAETFDILASEQINAAEEADAGMGYGMMQAETPSDAPLKSFVTDRSVAMGGRDNLSFKGAQAETVVSKSSTITVLATDLEGALDEVTRLANVNNGVAPETAVFNKGSADGAQMAVISQPQEWNENQKHLIYVFAEADYSAFIAALNDTFGAADVQTGAFVAEDMTDTMNVLIDQSFKYDSEIQRLQNNASENQKEISMLKNEKDIIDAKIEQLRLNSDFVTVTVFVNMK